MQLVALVELQVSVEEAPLAIEAGVAAIVTVGAGVATVTVADWLPLPPRPVHVSVKVAVALSAPVD